MSYPVCHMNNIMTIGVTFGEFIAAYILLIHLLKIIRYTKLLTVIYICRLNVTEDCQFCIFDRLTS